MNTAVITPAEADVYLAQYPNWLNLTNDQKLYFISRASAYVQMEWSCTNVDWDDDSTISPTIKEAVAYYAYADSANNLYGDVTEATEIKGPLRVEEYKLDTLAIKNQWYKGSQNSTLSSLGYPNSLMETECQLASSTTELIRV